MKSQSVRQINILDRVLILIRMNEFGDRTRVRRTTRYLEVTEDRTIGDGAAATQNPCQAGRARPMRPPRRYQYEKQDGWLAPRASPFFSFKFW